jgi:hypothetical protein
VRAVRTPLAGRIAWVEGGVGSYAARKLSGRARWRARERAWVVRAVSRHRVCFRGGGVAAVRVGVAQGPRVSARGACRTRFAALCAIEVLDLFSSGAAPACGAPGRVGVRAVCTGRAVFCSLHVV